MNTGIQAFDQSLEPTKEWIKEVQHELHYANPEDAYASLRAVLHVLRDRLTVQEACDLGAQLPLLLKGVYFDGWKTAHKPVKITEPQEFYGRVHQAMRGRQEYDPERITQAVFKVITRHVSSGEIDDVKNMLPEGLTELLVRAAKE